MVFLSGLPWKPFVMSVHWLARYHILNIQIKQITFSPLLEVNFCIVAAMPEHCTGISLPMLINIYTGEIVWSWQHYYAMMPDSCYLSFQEQPSHLWTNFWPQWLTEFLFNKLNRNQNKIEKNTGRRSRFCLSSFILIPLSGEEFWFSHGIQDVYRISHKLNIFGDGIEESWIAGWEYWVIVSIHF